MNRKIVLAILVVLSLLAVGFSEVYLPIIVKAQDDPGGTTVIPSGVLYVFPSSATTTGDAGGRSGYQQICPTENQAAHVCTLQEIENAWVSTGVLFDHPFPESWLDSAVLGSNFAYASNLNENGRMVESRWGYGGASSSGGASCGGWTRNSNLSGGTSIGDNASGLATPQCDTIHPVACCKWNP